MCVKEGPDTISGVASASTWQAWPCSGKRLSPRTM